MILSKADIKWIKLAHDLSVAASDTPNGEYVRNEMFLETAIDYTKTKTIDEYCVYNRKAKIPFGPYLAGGTLISILSTNPIGGNYILDWYYSTMF